MTPIDNKLLTGLLNGETSPQDMLEFSDQQVLENLDYHGITLLAAEQHALPPSLNSSIAQRKAMLAANESLKQHALAELFDAISTAGLTAILIKGSALAYTLYSKPWLRPRSDSDVLISPVDKSRVDHVLQQQGFTKLFAIEGELVSHQSTYGKPLVGKTFLNIDLHWQINNRQMFSHLITADGLKQNGQELANFASVNVIKPVVIPSNVDSLLIAAIHRAGHHNKELRLAWVYDIHLLANSLNEGQWLALVEQALTKRIALITAEALSLSQRFFNTEIEQSLLNELYAASNEPSAIFLDTGLSERHYFWADLKTLPSPSGKLKFLSETLVPSPDYVRRQMGTKSASIAYIKRFWRGLKRVF